jgi:uncharacterized protein
LWRLLLQYLTYRVILLPLLVNLLVATWLVLGGQRTAGGLAVSGYPMLPVISGVAGLLGALLSVWLAGRFLDRRPFADFGFHLNARWWLDLFFGLALGALLMTAVFLTELVLGWVKVTGQGNGRFRVARARRALLARHTDSGRALPVRRLL